MLSLTANLYATYAEEFTEIFIGVSKNKLNDLTISLFSLFMDKPGIMIWTLNSFIEKLHRVGLGFVGRRG